MGLSASQARLLSITQRLSDNELHSEILANSKMRLADQSVEAKNNYLKALDATKLQYVGFDGYGNAETVDLTFNSLMLYSDIKNQNILKNSNGQVLISETDYENYKNSTDMYDFICRSCGLTYNPTYTEQLDAYNTYLEEMEEFAIKYSHYLDFPVYDDFFNVVQDEEGHNLSCYASALGGTVTCYKHVLMFLLYPIEIDNNEPSDWNYNNLSEYGGGSPEHPEALTSSYYNGSGYEQVTPDYYDWRNSAFHTDFVRAEEGNKLLPVYEALLNESFFKCDGDDDIYPNTTTNFIQNAIDGGRVPTAAEILMSDYIYDPVTNECKGLKSLRQKAIDMLLLIKDQEDADNNSTPSTYGVTSAQFKTLLRNFTEGDMKNLRPTPPTPVDPPLMDFEDKAKVQWYINLWHAIDGQDDPSELRALYNEDGSFKSYTTENKFRQTKFDSSGNALNPSFQVIPDELKNDASWLQKALANGIVSINQITTDSNANKLVWSGIEYTSTTSFSEVADDKKVAKAEAEYQTEMKRIEMEDNKLDMKMKKLDTEHSALKTEYESISQLIGKNIERSYNTFNA